MNPEFRSLKIEDLKELQELVVTSVASIEPGLQLLDSQAVLGGSTIDLVTIDAEDVLTLIALGFEADDEMMLRALEAYSWCLEAPDELHQLYPVVSSTEPRVIFIAERIPQGFLRKIRHLRFRRVDCLEFHFGLQFSRVEEPEAPVEPPPPRPRPVPRAPRLEPAAPPPVAPPPPEPPPPPPPPPVAPAMAAPPARHHSRADAPPPRAVHRARIDAPRREEPVVVPGPAIPAVPIEESRAPAGRAAAAVSEHMVRTVREYLQREFPTAVIYDFYAHDRSVQMFHLQDSHGAVIHSAVVAEEVLGEGGEPQLRTLLEKHKLARVLRQAGSAAVAVTRTGLKIERR
ncbi:MAG TPA: hypothetical protein VIE37_06610 [Methylomirabilota bacterium]|jgi:hypothetical protein